MRNYLFVFILLGCLLAVGIVVSRTKDTSTPTPTTGTTLQPSPTPLSGALVPLADRDLRLNILAQLNKKTFEPKTILMVTPQDSSHISAVNEDILGAFPNTTISPLALPASLTTDELTQIITQAKNTCNKHCFVIAATDNSPQPELLTSLDNGFTRRALIRGNVTQLLQEADLTTPSIAAFVAQWATEQGTKRFTSHSPSSFYGWFEPGVPTVAEKEVSFTIAGDMMFGRLVAHRFLEPGFQTLFTNLGDRIFWGTDARVVNLEGPVSDQPVPDDIRPNNLNFLFPPQAIDALTYLRVNVASLANNHTGDKGASALATTRKLLSEANIQALGGPTAHDSAEIVRIKGEGITLILIGVPAVFSQPDVTNIIQQAEQEPNSRIILFPHWGHEYVYNHHPSQTSLAHAWIDAGADAVIGAHPHVIQDAELYQGKPVFYSLGNFVFDQTFSKETQQGLIAAGRFTENTLELFAIPHTSKSLKPELLEGDEKHALLDRLYQPFSDYKKTTPAGDILVFPL